MKPIFTAITSLFVLLLFLTLFAVDNKVKILSYGLLLLLSFLVLIGMIVVRAEMKKYNPEEYERRNATHYFLLGIISLMITYAVHGLLSAYDAFDLKLSFMDSRMYY